MFVRISPLLDILHCYFLHGAPWHGVLFFTPPLGRKTELPVGFLRAIKPGWESLHGDASLSSAPLRSANLWMQQMLFSVKLSASNFLSNIQPLTGQKLAISRFFVFLVPSPAPLTDPTKLPAYPSSPTPIWATGTLHYAPWTNPPASEQTTGRRITQPRVQSTDLKLYERYCEYFVPHLSNSFKCTQSTKIHRLEKVSGEWNIINHTEKSNYWQSLTQHPKATSNSRVFKQCLLFIVMPNFII